MEKHRSGVETSPTTSRRWVWELIGTGNVGINNSGTLILPDPHKKFFLGALLVAAVGRGGASGSAKRMKSSFTDIVCLQRT
jgi:hypothetical protein